MNQKSKPRDSRARNFATVVYLESAPSNWLEVIQELKIPVFVSPYHYKDINPNGEPKKPHYHVLLMFEGKKSDEQVRDIIAEFGGVGLEYVQSLRGYARYLCHMDNPEKAQYLPDDVLQYGGADYHHICELAVDRYNAIDEMLDWCIENKTNRYIDLLMYARVNRREWFSILCDSGTIVMREALRSLGRKTRNEPE